MVTDDNEMDSRARWSRRMAMPMATANGNGNRSGGGKQQKCVIHRVGLFGKHSNSICGSSSSSRSRSKNWKQAVTADKGRKGRAGVPVVTTTTNDRYYVNVKGGGKGRGSQAAANSGSENG